MATPRLTFLYPPFFRSISRRPEGAWQQTCLSVQLLSDRIAQKPKRRILHTSSGHRQAHVERHGKAVEGFPVAGIAKPAGQATSGAPANEKDSLQGVDADAVKAVSGAMTQPVVERAQTGQDTGARRVEKQPGKSASARGRSGTQSSKGKQASEGSGRAEELVEGELPAANTVAEPPSSGPLAAILHMPAPSSPAPPTSSTSHFLDVDHASDVAKPPLQTPPYVHHFDTYTLVQRVELGGFTTKQSITFMKAVRGLLARNLDVAREGLVSKSDVENETYLFRAACSELKTEVQNNRRAQDEEMRRERTHLQHETDILTQQMNQEILTLKDNLKGMFDDRKMGVRSEQRDVASKIQELNYKITVVLNSDAKSEVEGLRWVLTRRSVMGILFMALMVLASLRFAKYRTRAEENRRKLVQGSPGDGVHTGPPRTTRDSGHGVEEELAASGGG